MFCLSLIMSSFATHPLSEFVNTKLLAKKLPHPGEHKAYIEDIFGEFAGFCISVFLFYDF